MHVYILLTLLQNLQLKKKKQRLTYVQNGH